MSNCWHAGVTGLNGAVGGGGGGLQVMGAE